MNNLIDQFKKEAEKLGQNSNSIEEFKLWIEAEDPKNYLAERRAEKFDLSTFPEEVIEQGGSNCSNCMYVSGNFCLHKEIDQELWDGAEKMCCNLWNQVGLIRIWKDEPTKLEDRDKNLIEE